MRHAFVLGALRVTRRQADTKQVQLPKTARSRVPLLIFFIGVITPGNSPVGRGGMMRGRIQSGTWPKGTPKKKSMEGVREGWS